MEKRPTAEQLAKYKSNAKNESFSADVRAKFQSIVDKFENVGEAVVDAVEQKKERKPRTTKTTTKVVATKQTKSDIESAKAEIKKRTGKTEEECESIVNEYRSLRAKSQERKKKETIASADNKERVDKLKKDDKIISGTNEKTADAVIETTTKDVAEKIVKEIEKIEQKAEVEATKEVKKEMPKESATEQNKVIAEKTEEKVKAIVKIKTKNILVDTSDLLTSIAETLGKFDKDSQKVFLIKLRSDIDKLLTKFSYGGSTMGATQTFNITQSNMSSSSVNPTMFNGGGGVGSSKNEKIMLEFRQETSDLRNQSYPRMSLGQAVQIATDYMSSYTKEELIEAIKNDKQIEMFGMESTWINAVKRAKKSKMENGGGVDSMMRSRRGMKFNDGGYVIADNSSEFPMYYTENESRFTKDINTATLFNSKEEAQDFIEKSDWSDWAYVDGFNLGGGGMAKGGMTEHGLRVGDEILLDLGENKVGVKSKDRYIHSVDLDKGFRSFGDGGRITNNDDIITAFLTTTKEHKVNNLSTHYSTLANVMLLKNYGTIIAKRTLHNRKIVYLNSTKYSVTTTRLTNKVRYQATKLGLQIVEQPSDEFANGGGVDSMMRSRRGM